MSQEQQEGATRTSRTFGRYEKVNWRLPLYAAILLLVFLFGFIPTCFVSRHRGLERDTAQAALPISNLDDTITSLARSDPYSADRLTKLYNQYREAITNVAAG